jgi:tripartite ATP-independent transporter DctM subunit
MIPVLFLVVLLLIGAYVAFSGRGGPEAELPWIELLSLTAVFVVFFLSGIYVAAAIGSLALFADLAFSGRNLNLQFGQTAWDVSRNFTFVAIPLFLLMGEILLATGLSNRLYRAMNLWVGHLPGGLLHTNIAASAVFSAVSGSSVACAATVGSVALPYFAGTKYPQRVVLGSLAAGGALGNLIPPGISLLIYALLTDTSVGALYAASAVAGVFTAGLFMLWIVIRSIATKADYATPHVTWRERVMSIWDLLPTVMLIIVVLGTLYLGLATATEAAALGVVGSILVGLGYRTLGWEALKRSLRNTTRTTAMIGLILFGAVNLNYVLGALHLPSALAATIIQFPLPREGIMFLILFFYLALGTFMDALAMILTTVPVIFPIVVALGYDPIWFGVALTMLTEIALISPPDGNVMYVLQGLRRPPGPISDVFWGVIPFDVVYIAALLIIFAFPQLILWTVAQ